MPAKKDAEYWRLRRERIRQQTEQSFIDGSVEGSPIDRNGDRIETPKKGYDCGCRPGDKCMSHSIAALSQKQRDAILDRINRGFR